MAPVTAPARYVVAPAVTCGSDRPNAFLSSRMPASEPANVTCKPSRSHDVPSATMIFRCQALKGRRSSRAGTSVSMDRSWVAGTCAHMTFETSPLFQFALASEFLPEPLTRGSKSALLLDDAD